MDQEDNKRKAHTVRCHGCGDPIVLRQVGPYPLDTEDSICYFHQIMTSEFDEPEDDLYWCSWDCLWNHMVTDIKWRKKLIEWLNRRDNKSVTIDIS